MPRRSRAFAAEKRSPVQTKIDIEYELVMPQKPPRARSDISMKEVDDGEFEVRDPIRSAIFHFSPVQKSIFDRLGGQLSADAVTEQVSEEFEIEIPVVDVEEFVTFLRTHYLLDISEYDLNDPGFSKRALRKLKTSRLWERAWKRAGNLEGADIGDLSRALGSIESGDLNTAIELLLVDDDVGPEIVAVLRREYFGSQNTGEEERLWSLGNPDRVLTIVDRAIGRWLYHPIGVIALLTLVCAAAHQVLTSQMPIVGSVTWLSAILGYFLKYALTLFGHEILGHGLAAKHFGGTVPDVGATLRNGSTVVFYCDVSDALHAKQSRAAKVLIFLGGVLVDIALASILVLVWVGLFGKSMPGPIFVAALLLLYSFIENSLPIRGHDGCWALAVVLRLQDLWLGENTHAYWKQRLGFVDADGPGRASWPSREVGIYRIFGILEVAVVLLYFFGLWLPFMVPLLVTYAGNAGFAIAALPTIGFFRMRIWPLVRGATILVLRRSR